MPTSVEQESLAARRVALLQELAAIGDFRPGALISQYRKCGKPTCHCARPDSSGHGPYWLITHRAAGKTRSQAVPAGPWNEPGNSLRNTGVCAVCGGN